jgi:LAS superfamily LD-carboxypeptidase LdcB
MHDLSPAFSAAQLTGRDVTHVVSLPGTALLLHQDVVAPFLALQAAAAVDGIDLRPVSAFRDFDRQCRIFNEKCNGLRPLLDRQGQQLDPATMAADALVDAVLVWSALPGASRHHWGTDLDVIDAAAVPKDYVVQLTAGEFAPDGPFARLDAWLARHAAKHGFYRPYGIDRGGVQAEPWHISHGPLALRALQCLSVGVLEEALRGASLAVGPALLARLPELHARYVTNVEAYGG